ncbi:hypothetical protein [Clostridium sp. ZS2-4]|uniref:hypothetical protein n=1 Tax=Clostridium sp. ZS2-4 TaxID=2987703 RepID=UPI00227A68EC|nr:hypothetical protein [Clostridium sp. ZS2-4]MCY6354454.1 hypothetical protein [Clostridium sp. ZS2-4]
MNKGKITKLLCTALVTCNLIGGTTVYASTINDTDSKLSDSIKATTTFEENTSTETLTQNEEELNQKLLKKGLPSYYLDDMPLALKEDIIQNSGTFQWAEVGSRPKGSRVRRDISSSELDFYMQCYNTKSYKGKIRQKIYVYYKWKGHGVPLCRFTDCFAISWENDWSAVPDSWYHVDEVRYQDGSTDFSEYSTVADIKSTGISWDADLKAWAIPFGKYEKSVGGYGRVTIEQNTKGKPSTNKVCAKYAHATSPWSGLGFTFGPASLYLNGKGDTKGASHYLDL